MAQDRSDYYFDLHGNGKSRYEEKLVAIDLPIDLFSIQEDEFELSKDFTKRPDISYADIFEYLINFPSIYTKKSLKAYKSLESDKYVLSGLVFDIQVKRINNGNYLIRAKIRHGQSMFTKTPNKAWICVKGDGEILHEHCSCMAGLGEVRSHDGAIMFYVLLTLEYCRRNSENACTSQSCSWLPPSLKEVEFAELSCIDFSDARKRLNKNKVNVLKQALRKFLPHQDEKQQFYTKLHQTGMDSAILRITPVFCERFIPSVAEIRTALFNFYHENYEQLLYHELIHACVKEYMKININTNKVELIEKKRQGSSLNQTFGIEQGQGLLLLVILGHVVIQTLLNYLKF